MGYMNSYLYKKDGHYLPTDDLVLLLDSTVSSSINNPVSNWDDLSGEQNHFEQTNSNYRPSIGNGGGVTFQSTQALNGVINPSSRNNMDVSTWFFVFTTGSDISTYQIVYTFKEKTFSKRINGLIRCSSGRIYVYFYDTSENDAHVANVIVSPNTTYLVSVVWDINILYAYLDSSFIGSTNTNYEPALTEIETETIGNRYDGHTSQYFRGEVHLIAQYITAMNHNDRGNIETLLMNEFNI